MRILRQFLLLVLLLAVALPLAAQKRNINLTLSVTGPVGQALPSADLTLIQTDYSITYGGVTLNAEGTTTVKVYPGNHSLAVVLDGYETANTTFAVTADTTVSVQLKEKNLVPYSLAVDVAHDAQTGLNDVLFTWNTEEPVFWDDFEGYDAFSINFAPWSGIDGDGLNAAPISGSYLNRATMQYAQIMNPLKVEPAWWYDYPVLRPYGGQQYVGFTRTESGAANDDWLISPTITPGTQNILSFMAKAADVYKEKYQVYVTTKVDNPTKSDFTMISDGNYETVDYKGWHEKQYDLSLYAGKPIKFAIRYISCYNNGGSFMLMVDNVYVGQKYGNPNASNAPRKAIRVAKKSPLNPNESFRVFLNDSVVGTTDNYEWDFPTMKDGTYKFGVQAVYASSQTEIVDTVITIETKEAKVVVNVTTNNGKSVEGNVVELVDAKTSYVYSAEIVDGAATFPSLPQATYYMGVSATNFEVYSQEVKINGDVTLNVVLKEKIVSPFNITTDVRATAIGINDVTVKWNQNISFKDSFEDYSDFATGTFGKWTTYDLDQHNCYPIGLGSQTNIVTFPGASTPSNPCPVPPMVFNPLKTEPSMASDNAVLAPSGDKTVIFFSPQNNGANKWLVSPEYTIRDNFVCRFTAKAYAEYTESMEVCAFTEGGSNPEKDAYEVVSTISSLSYGQWTIYETDLSKYAGQKIRLGVHYTSFDAFFAQLDDFYVGNLSDDGTTTDVGDVKSYLITLDGDTVGEVEEPQCVISGVGTGRHTVGVQARYASGFSEFATSTFTVFLAGDFNGDGQVNVSDVTVLMNRVLNHATSATLDLNGDGQVNVSDVTYLLNLILSTTK